MTKLNQYTKIQTIRITEIQYNSLKTLESKGVNVSQFIRIAIKEKIKREWKIIKLEPKKIFCPF